MFTLNLLLDEKTLDKLTMLLCPDTLGLKNLTLIKCRTAKDDSKVCLVCWRKAIMKHNKKVEKMELLKTRQEKQTVPSIMDTTEWCRR